MSDTPVCTINYKFGDTYPIKMSLTTTSSKAAVDITGNTFVLHVWPTKAAVLSGETFTVTGSITSGTGGTFQFPMSTVESNNDGSFFHQVKMNDGDIQTILEGPLNFNVPVPNR